MVSLLLVIQAFYFFLPAYFANMAPVIVKKIPLLKHPLDLGIKIKGKPLLGKNKTFRGLVFGIFFSLGITYIQSLLSSIDLFRSLTIVDYGNWFVIGLLLGAGAIFGDAIESFVKRRLGYDSGQRFFPFDQIDFVLGGILFVSFSVYLSLEIIVTLVILSMLLHILVNHIAYYTGIRKEKW